MAPGRGAGRVAPAYKGETTVIFESLHESNQRGELLLVEDGMCRWHARQDGVITIYEIISQRPGCGQAMLAHLIEQSPRAIVAKCPADFAANQWYARRGFVLDRTETTKSGTPINVWRLAVADNPK